MNHLIKILMMSFFVSLSASADVLKCIPGGNGWVLKNITKNIVFGNGYYGPPSYLDRSICENVRASMVTSPDGKLGVVCAQSNSGTTIYNINDGTEVRPSGYYTESKLCIKALKNMTDWVVCLPGSKIELYDMRTGNDFGWYSTLERCTAASATARSEDPYVCRPSGWDSGYHAIYDRNDMKQPASRQRFLGPYSCSESLRGTTEK